MACGIERSEHYVCHKDVLLCMCVCTAREHANAFSELTDPVEQRRRFEQQVSACLRASLRVMKSRARVM